MGTKKQEQSPFTLRVVVVCEIPRCPWVLPPPPPPASNLAQTKHGEVGKIRVEKTAASIAEEIQQKQTSKHVTLYNRTASRGGVSAYTRKVEQTPRGGVRITRLGQKRQKKSLRVCKIQGETKGQPLIDCLHEKKHLLQRDRRGCYYENTHTPTHPHTHKHFHWSAG